MNRFRWAQGPNATYQATRSLAFGSGEEDFLGFLPYMGGVATLVMWPRPHEQTVVSPTHGGSTWNLALIGQVVLEKIIFENGGRTDDGRTRP